MGAVRDSDGEGTGPRRRSIVAVAMLACVALLVSCSTGGVYHRVGRGENLYRIGKAYGVDYREIARANRIRPPYEISTGSRLYIPGATRQVPVEKVASRSASGRRQSMPPVGSKPFSWPVTTGRVTSSFGKRARGHHDGIDIAAPRGSSVIAARDGKVIYSDHLSGYGNVVILEHASGYTTVYAHNDRNLVRKGTRARRGQKIATVGSTGKAATPLLHFEIRKNNVARNPLYYLPRG